MSKYHCPTVQSHNSSGSHVIIDWVYHVPLTAFYESVISLLPGECLVICIIQKFIISVKTLLLPKTGEQKHTKALLLLHALRVATSLGFFISPSQLCFSESVSASFFIYFIFFNISLNCPPGLPSHMFISIVPNHL